MIWIVLIVVATVAAYLLFGRQTRRPVKQSPAPRVGDPDLRALGISNIRPRLPGGEHALPSRAPAAEQPATEEPVVDETSPVRTASERGSLPQSFSEGIVSAPRPAAPAPAGGPIPALLEAARAALEARAVALLRRDEVGSAFVVESIAGSRPGLVRRGRLRVDEPLAETGSDELIRGVELERLGLRSEDLAPGDVALLRRIPGLEHALLLIYAPTASAADAADLADHFARLLARIETGKSADAPATASTSVPTEEPAPRSRLGIISEEMESARSADHSLAFALVWHGDAELVAEEGDDAIAEAEHHLQTFLETASPDGRVELFGELTFGIFHQVEAADAEAWARSVRETEWPNGEAPPVHIGIAMLGDRHESADDFRADAMTALHEAYSGGLECVILE